MAETMDNAKLDRLRAAIQSAMPPDVAVECRRAMKGGGALVSFRFTGDPGPRFQSKRWRDGIGDAVRNLTRWHETNTRGSGHLCYLTLDPGAVLDVLEKSRDD